LRKEEPAIDDISILPVLNILPLGSIGFLYPATSGQADLLTGGQLLFLHVFQVRICTHFTRDNGDRLSAGKADGQKSEAAGEKTVSGTGNFT
jgi:hypothetical protein